MEGCGGNCDFKINREYQLKCENNGCKEGYFEILPGQCELCKNYIKGCNKCSYIENIEIKYIMIERIRKRELICNDNCEEKNIFKVDNKCVNCSDIHQGCIECFLDKNNNIKCNKTIKGYYIDNKGNSVKV